jgi:hypothetical protein
VLRETYLFGWLVRARGCLLVRVQLCGARRRYACHGHILFVPPRASFVSLLHQNIMKFRCNEIVDISWQSDREWERIILFRPVRATPSVYFCFVCLSRDVKITHSARARSETIFAPPLRFRAPLRFFLFLSLPPPGGGSRGYSTSDLLLLRHLAFACALEFVFSIFQEFSFCEFLSFCILLICISRGSPVYGCSPF